MSGQKKNLQREQENGGVRGQAAADTRKKKKEKEANKVITILFHLFPLVPMLSERYIQAQKFPNGNETQKKVKKSAMQ